MLQFHFASVEIWNYTEQYESVCCWFKTRIISYHKNQERTGKIRERAKKGTIIDHMTERKRCQNLAKCYSVSLQSWMDQWNLLRNERPRLMFWKSLPVISSKMRYRFDVSWKTVVFIVQSGLKLYNFSIVAVRVKTEHRSE